jgi:hypothetical protein
MKIDLGLLVRKNSNKYLFQVLLSFFLTTLISSCNVWGPFNNPNDPTGTYYGGNGLIWTARTLPSSADWYSVTYGNGVFVAVAQNSTAAATSPDGITWTARTLPNTDNWQSVSYGNGVFVAVAYVSTTAATSP